MRTFHMTVSWSKSRSRDTYGYTICRLDAPVFALDGSRSTEPEYYI